MVFRTQEQLGKTEPKLTFSILLQNSSFQTETLTKNLSVPDKVSHIMYLWSIRSI